MKKQYHAVGLGGEGVNLKHETLKLGEKSGGQNQEFHPCFASPTEAENYIIENNLKDLEVYEFGIYERN